jgi:hypothetical protein
VPASCRWRGDQVAGVLLLPIFAPTCTSSSQRRGEMGGEEGR